MSAGLAGQVALVTGAAQGIGSAIVRALMPARIFATDIDAGALALLTRETGAEAAALDVTDEAAIVALVARVTAEAGSIDILVHCAGGVRGQVGRPVETVAEEDWHAIMDVNATGAFLVAKHVAPVMKRQGSGRIVNISSVAGLGPSGSSIAYAVSKAGLIHLTKCMAVALAPHVLVNCVAPGLLEGTRATANLSNAQIERSASGALLKREIKLWGDVIRANNIL